MITFDKKQRVFHLSNPYISYMMQVEEFGYLTHLYFGKKVAHYSGGFRYPRVDRSFSPNPSRAQDRLFSLDKVLLEYPTSESGNFREHAFSIQYEDGSFVSQFTYDRYEQFSGTVNLEGLPQARAREGEAETLIVYLVENTRQLELQLQYTIFKDFPILSRCVRVKNKSEETVKVQAIASAAIDFPAQTFEVLHLTGSWANERQVSRELVTKGIKQFGSTRGASSHFENPFLALITPETTEGQGEAYGFSFVYSGNHLFSVQKDEYDQTRLTIGIHPERFFWKLSKGEVFQSPEVILNYSTEGLTGLSSQFHAFIHQTIIPERFQQVERPVLINNWEATYFSFDAEKLKQLIDAAKTLGVELFVLDDGWFGERNDDLTSLGDWYVNKDKLPAGLAEISEYAHQNGLLFGLWFEPEMVSPRSKLYEKHPEWVLGDPRNAFSLSRNQLVLDLSNPEVIAYLFSQMSELLRATKIDYIKWDMNRNISETFSTIHSAGQQGEIAHRYILGLYALLERLTVAFPNILFEGCSGGGGRFDLGMLYYMPQIWTSDNTDAAARVNIQYGTSLLYPLSTMGAHISAVPNHQTNRAITLATRAIVAMSDLLGVEMDPTKLTKTEFAALHRSIEFYKKIVRYSSMVD